MRRALFDTVSVVIGSGKVVDREGFLSAVYAASIGSITGSPTAAKLTVKVEPVSYTHLTLPMTRSV